MGIQNYTYCHYITLLNSFSIYVEFIIDHFEVMSRRKPDVHNDSSDEAEEVHEEVEDPENTPIENSDEEGEDLEEQQ